MLRIEFKRLFNRAVVALFRPRDDDLSQFWPVKERTLITLKKPKSFRTSFVSNRKILNKSIKLLTKMVTLAPIKPYHAHRQTNQRINQMNTTRVNYKDKVTASSKSLVSSSSTTSCKRCRQCQARSETCQRIILPKQRKMQRAESK